MPKGNPKWGKPEQPAGSCLTEFDKKCAELALMPDQYLRSEELRVWAALHKNTRYVPEPLLKAWGLTGEFAL